MSAGQGKKDWKSTNLRYGNNPVQLQEMQKLG